MEEVTQPKPWKLHTSIDTEKKKKTSKDAPQAAISGCHSSWALKQKDRERERQADGEERVEKVGVVAQWRLIGRQEADGANKAEVFNELLERRGEERRGV